MKGFNVFEELQSIRNEFPDHSCEVRIEIDSITGSAMVKFILYNSCYSNRCSSMFFINHNLGFSKISIEIKHARNCLREKAKTLGDKK